MTVNVSGLSSSVQDLADAYPIGVSSTRLILTQGIGTAGATGIVTFFPISGDISQIRTNDRFKVGLSTETVKVLDVDPISNRLRVLRPVEAVGVSHTQSTILEEIPRVFTFESTLARSPDNKESVEFALHIVEDDSIKELIDKKNKKDQKDIKKDTNITNKDQKTDKKDNKKSFISVWEKARSKYQKTKFSGTDTYANPFH